MRPASRAASHGAVVLLLTVTVALCVSPDGKDVADLGAGKDDGAAQEPGGEAQGAAGEGGQEAATKELLTPWDKQGLQVIQAYADYNKKLQGTEKSLREKLANPPEKVKGIEYNSIPGYKFKYLGREMEDKSRSECELVCSTYSACKSYSYNAQRRKCVWSMSRVNYDMDWAIWIKKMSPEGNRNELYNEVSGIKVQDKLEPMDKTLEKYPTAPDEPTSWDECEMACTQKPDCKTFSYAHSKSECVLSAVEMHYEPLWTYYEKADEPQGDSEWKKEHAKENDQKEELKMQWIQGSSAKARAEAEKAAKVEKELMKTKSKAKEASQQELRARKAAGVDESRCLIAKAEVEGAAKRNTLLLEQLEKGNTKVVDIKRQRMEAETNLKNSKTYEATKKAELKITIFDVKEVENKAAQLKADEVAEKKRGQGSNENKEKACGAYDITEATFAAKEGAFKQSEAKQKMLTAGELVGTAKENMATARGEVTNQESRERKQKMFIAVKKTQVEASNKRSAAATTEIAKKEALQRVQKDKELLRKATTKGEMLTHAVMVAKEKAQKTKESTSKEEEKETKAEHLLKSRKRESDMKAEAVRVRKKLKIKKENDDKSERGNKDLKKEELRQKKTDEQRSKGEASLKTMTADELKKKTDLQTEEKTYKDVQKQKEMNVKAEKKHKQHLKDLQQEEDDEKYMQRKNALTKRVLRENEMDAKKMASDADQEAKDAADKATADEQHEKAAAAALKKATTEADTKQLLRNELNSKSQLTASSEQATKAQQHKMLTAEDLVQAQAKQQAEACIHICKEGLEVRNKEFEMQQAQPVNQTNPTPAPAPTEPPTSAGPTQEPTGAPIETPQDRMVLMDLGEGTVRLGEGAHSANQTEAKKEVQEETAAKLKVEKEKEEMAKSMPATINIPPVEPFMYNGCEC